MLHLPDVRAALLRELHAPRSAPVFDAGRHRQPLLASYPSPDVIVAVLWDNDDDALADRITCALLAEQQARPAPLWCAVLTLAYFPMLTTLASAMKRRRPTNAAVDELVLHAFLDAVHELPAAVLPGRALRRLRQRTRRAAFRRTREAFDEHRREPLTLSDDAPDPLLEAAGVARWRREEADRTLHLLVASTPPKHRTGLDVLFATTLEGESLARYAARTHPAAGDDERARIAALLKRRRSRALARLREALLAAAE